MVLSIRLSFHIQYQAAAGPKADRPEKDMAGREYWTGLDAEAEVLMYRKFKN